MFTFLHLSLYALHVDFLPHSSRRIHIQAIAMSHTREALAEDVVSLKEQTRYLQEQQVENNSLCYYNIAICLKSTLYLICSRYYEI